MNTNYFYIRQYAMMLFGIELPVMMGITWFGQPAGLIVGEELLEGKLNSLVGWVCNGTITVDKCKEIHSRYYDIVLDKYDVVDYDSEDMHADYTFTEGQYEEVKAAFVRIYECAVPVLER